MTLLYSIDEIFYYGDDPPLKVDYTPLFRRWPLSIPSMTPLYSVDESFYYGDESFVRKGGKNGVMEYGPEEYRGDGLLHYPDTPLLHDYPAVTGVSGDTGASAGSSGSEAFFL